MINVFYWLAMFVSGAFLVLALVLFVMQWTIYSRVEATMWKLWEQRGTN